jgi:CRP/FNR family transcriptional regulator, cyclic AMP receptor protein
MPIVRTESAYLKLARVLLKGAAGFQHCSDQTIDSLLADARLEQMPRGAIVCRRGEPFEELCLIVQGTLESAVQLDPARRHLVAYSSAGHLLGFICCVDGLPIPHDLIAHTDAIVLRIPVAAINRRRLVDSGISRAFEIQLASRTRQFYDRLSNRLLSSFEVRLSLMLLELANQFGLKREGATMIALRMPQSDLADLLGVSRQRLNQELKAFERRGILQARRSSIESVDLKKLEAIATTGCTAFSEERQRFS